MKIAYFGGDMFFSCLKFLIEEGHEIIALYSYPPKQGEYDFVQNVVKQANLLHIPVKYHRPTEHDMQLLSQEKCTMILSAGYPYKIPDWHNYKIRYAINIHPSLLPVGAGPLPLPMIILKGLKKTGLTLHELTSKWDAGNIILQEAFSLSGSENIEDLLIKNQEIALSLLKQFMQDPDMYWQNSTAQIIKEENYWPMPADKSQFIIDYNMEFETLSRTMLAHRYVNPAGEIECISNISFWQQDHSFETGTIISQQNNLFQIAIKKGFIYFKLIVKPPFVPHLQSF